MFVVCLVFYPLPPAAEDYSLFSKFFSPFSILLSLSPVLFIFCFSCSNRTRRVLGQGCGRDRFMGGGLFLLCFAVQYPSPKTNSDPIRFFFDTRNEYPFSVHYSLISDLYSLFAAKLPRDHMPKGENPLSLRTKKQPQELLLLTLVVDDGPIMVQYNCFTIMDVDIFHKSYTFT
jgi:hypothetical protein